MDNELSRFDCAFSVREAFDINDVGLCRQILIDVINDPGFEVMLGNMRVSVAAARGGPAPRGSGEISGGCSSDFGGRTECRVEGRWRF